MGSSEGAPARRQPVQERSRRTVAAILDAAEAIIDADGITAATTRAIAEKAGVAYPSLYRFFSDRDQILDALLERHALAADEQAMAHEPMWAGRSGVDLLNAEFDLLIAYYRQHPSAARLWLEGRASEAVARFVHRRIQIRAERLRVLIATDETELDPRSALLIVELADRVMELAYRGRDDFDDELLEMGRTAVLAYVATLPGVSEP